MVFGHNTNLKVGEVTYHIQTEDRGASHALIDTTVYYRGRVLHRRTNNYFDLLPLNPDREHSLKLRLDDQHRSTIEELRSGALNLPIPHDEKPAAAPNQPPSQASAGNDLSVQLLNGRTWLTGKHALLQIAIRDSSNNAVEGAKITARMDGSADHFEMSTETGPFGHAQFEFDMPRFSSAEPALVIDAVRGPSKGHLRFHLKAKPRVPSAAS
jgi:hypothetical protein